MALQFNVWVPSGCGAMPTNLLNNMEPLTIATANVIPPLSYPPVGGLLMLVVNGATFTPDDGSFTYSGNTITWTSTIYSVNPGDTVVAIYSYMG
jgi:hypothetical protein